MSLRIDQGQIRAAVYQQMLAKRQEKGHTQDTVRDKERQASMSKTKPNVEPLSQLMPIYQRLLPTQVIEQLIAETKQVFYQRLLPPVVVVWGFIFQRLNADHSCDAAWGHLTSEAASPLRGGRPLATQSVSESTSAYVQARQRLPLGVAQGALRYSAQALQAEFAAGLWRGWRVNLFDGSTLQLHATQELKAHYGVPSNQYGKAHWPLLRTVVGFDLWSGAAYGLAEGPYRLGEHQLAHTLIGDLGAGFLHVGDRNFGVYAILQSVVGAGSQALLRLKVTQAKRLGGASLQPGCDLQVDWSPSQFDDCQPDLPTPAIPGRLIYARLEKPGFRPIDLYLFTTLLDAQAYPAQAIVDLYGCRWRNEIDLRHVKTTLMMEALDGKSVDLVRKELYLGLLAYNLVRSLMGLAALRAGVEPLQLSLSMCWRRTMSIGHSLPEHPSDDAIDKVLEYLLGRLSRCRLPKRHKERFEPRAVWGRPKVFPIIKGSRELARQTDLEKMNPKS